MASDVGLKGRTGKGNDAGSGGDDLLHESGPSSLDQKLDNDSQRNNNESRTVIGSSFIPVRNSSLEQGRLVQRFRSPDDNRTTAAFAGKVSYSHLCLPSSQNYPRRHSVCVEGLSQVASNHGHKNYNQDSRFSAVRHRAASPSSLCPASALLGGGGAAAASSDVTNGLKGFDLRNGNENEKYLRSNSYNGVQRPEDLQVAPPIQRLKDKSFIRKSTLNRIEFVQPAQQTLGYMPNSSQKAQVFDQHSTSEASGDGTDGKSAPGASTSMAVKRKSAFFQPLGKDFTHHSQNNSGGRSASLGSRPLTESLKYRHKRGAKGCMPCFERKSFSAGEHEIQTDTNDCSRKTKVCFSAQETYTHESKQSVVNRQPMPLESTKNCVPCSNYVQDSPEQSQGCKTMLSDLANGKSCCYPKTAPDTCDNSSLFNPQQETADEDSIAKAAEVDNDNDKPSNDRKSEFSTGENAVAEKTCTALDKDLFASRCSPVPMLRPHPFPVSDDDEDICSNSAACTEVIVNEDVRVCDEHCDEDIINVMDEVACLDLSPTGSSFIKSSSYDSDKDNPKQPINSILRKKSDDDRREIHGILKNTVEDKVSVKQPPSILKHRESSEEKDSWQQSDRHSILKKSSEDESSSSSPVRPILKNTSTDDESSGSKPKPILKKRTSFNEDCSYACFHGNELKPILKKKTINDLCEEQPKPILKTRRKSEEAASISSEFPLGGARPRAYSADRGIRIASDKKLNEDDFT